MASYSSKIFTKSPSSSSSSKMSTPSSSSSPLSNITGSTTGRISLSKSSSSSKSKSSSSSRRRRSSSGGSSSSSRSSSSSKPDMSKIFVDPEKSTAPKMSTPAPSSSLRDRIATSSSGKSLLTTQEPDTLKRVVSKPSTSPKSEVTKPEETLKLKSKPKPKPMKIDK